jgi:hypothetical protein
MTGAMLNFAACFILKPFHAHESSLKSEVSLKAGGQMLNKEILTKEVSELDMLINAVSSDIAQQLALKNRSDATEELLEEMHEALVELRLARGVRVMLLNAFGTRSSRREAAGSYDQSSRRASGQLRRAS